MSDRLKPLYIIGAGGHAKVVIQTARAMGFRPVAIYDDNEQLQGNRVCDVPVQGKIRDLSKSDMPAVVAIGNNRIRKEIADSLKLDWQTLIHPNAVVDPAVTLGRGTVVFAGAVVQVDTQIGCHAIINTSVSVDHDCVIGDFAHIAPGCHLSGAVTLGEGVLLGVGSCARPLLKIGHWSIIGAGAAVVSEIPDQATAVGVPAKVIRVHN